MKHELEVLYDKLENSKLTANHIKVIAAACLGDMLEFFDLVIIGYVLAFIVGPWGMSYGQSSIILLSAGIGAILGAFVFGALADRFGRRPIFMTTILVFSIATGAMYLTQDGAWGYLTFMRFFCGFGVGGLYVVDMPLVQEFVPTRYRAKVSAAVVICAVLGFVLAGLVTATLAKVVGWRGLFLIGLLPAFLSLYGRAYVPESPRWLIRQGRYQEAANSMGWVLGMGKIYPNQVTGENLPAHLTQVEEKAKFTDLFKYPRLLIVNWFNNLCFQTGIYALSMWGPTILVLILGITPAQAAFKMIFVSGAAMLGMVLMVYLADKIGRRMMLVFAGITSAIMFALTGFYHSAFLGGVSVVWVLMMISNFFAQAGLGMSGMYASESWPMRLKATGMGSTYGFGGLGKILGPLGLALIAGSANIVTPAATITAITPAFLLYGLMLLIGGCSLIFGYETRGKSIEEYDKEIERSRRAA